MNTNKKSQNILLIASCNRETNQDLLQVRTNSLKCNFPLISRFFLNCRLHVDWQGLAKKFYT